MVRVRITHAYCPPPPPTDVSALWDMPGGGVRMPDTWCRRASWADAQGPFCVGDAAGRMGVHLLDFASAASPCAIGVAPRKLGRFEVLAARRCCTWVPQPSPLMAHLQHFACAASH